MLHGEAIAWNTATRVAGLFSKNRVIVMYLELIMKCGRGGRVNSGYSKQGIMLQEDC